MSEYAERDVMDLSPYYERHVSAMTGEKLHSKSDIAAELAYRDKQIAALEKRLAEDASGGIDHRADALADACIKGNDLYAEAQARIAELVRELAEVGKDAEAVGIG